MAEWPDDLLAGTDRPRALPPALRRRLEEQLLSGADTARSLTPELSAKLASDLSDPVAVVLADVDGPRDLRPELRRQLHSQLGRRRRRARVVAAAAAAVIVIAGAGVVVRRATESRSSGRPVAAASAPAPPGTVLAQGGQADSGLAARPAAGPIAGAGNRIDSSAPAPVNPPAGPSAGGTWVTITGNGFTGATAVRFGSTAAARVVVVSDDQLRVLTPAHPAGVVDVTIVTPAGTRPVGRYTYGS